MGVHIGVVAIGVAVCVWLCHGRLSGNRLEALVGANPSERG